MAKSCSKCAKPSGWLPRARGRDRGHAGDDQGGSRRARHQARRLLLRGSLSQGTSDEVEADHRGSARKGPHLRGPAEKPKGHDDGEWEDREQTLFKSTAFGDDGDRALMKSDGSYTYFAGDVAYHHNKLGRGFKHLINVFGADHVGYIPRMLAVIAAYTGGKPDQKKWHSFRRLCGFRDQGRPACKTLQARRAIQDVEAGRHVRDASRRGRRGRIRPRPLHDALPARTSNRSISTSPRSPNNQRTIPFSMSSTPMPAPCRCSGRPRRRSPISRKVWISARPILDYWMMQESLVWSANWPISRVQSRGRQGPVSRTGSPTISMILLRLFTGIGRVAINRHICVLSKPRIGG